MATNSSEDVYTDYGNVIVDTRRTLGERLRSVCFEHREANSVAHTLAKLALFMFRRESMDTGRSSTNFEFNYE